MMKKSFLAVLATLCTLFALSGAQESIPVVWKSPNKTFRELQTYAFGFAQTEKEYKFMFQIKSLDALLENDLALLTFYVDSDNNKDTGRFKGWDLQLNVLLKRHAVSAVVWSKGEIKSSYSFREGEFSVSVQPDDNMLVITVKKVIFLKNISIGGKFVLFEEHTNGQGKVENELMTGVEVTLK